MGDQCGEPRTRDFHSTLAVHTHTHIHAHTSPTTHRSASSFARRSPADADVSTRFKLNGFISRSESQCSPSSPSPRPCASCYSGTRTPGPKRVMKIIFRFTYLQRPTRHKVYHPHRHTHTHLPCDRADLCVCAVYLLRRAKICVCVCVV